MSRFVQPFVLAVSLLVNVSAIAAEAPFVLVQTLSSKGPNGGLDHLAVDGKGGRVFLANKSNNTLDVFDLKSGKLIQQVPDQVKVSGVSYAADLDTIYVGNGGGVCNGIDGKTYKVVFSTKCEKADNVYYHSGNHQVYVQHGVNISILDGKTGERKKQLDLGAPTKEFRIDKKNNLLYVNLGKPGNVLAVVDLAKNEIVAKHKITMSDGNGPLAFDSKNHIAYIGCGGTSPMVIALDVKSGKELANVGIPAGIDNLHFDGKRNRVYASCDGFLVTIEKKDDKLEVISKIETAQKAKTSAYAGGPGRLYLGVPKQVGKDGPEVRVYEARPVVETKKEEPKKAATN
jgi:DNA-binding beta-propeller fold protein YncE